MRRSWLGRLALRAGRVPRYVPIGARDPQQQVRVILEGLDAPLDVTRNHVMVGLRPLTIALALPTVPHRMLRRPGLRLAFTAVGDPTTLLGSVRVRHEGDISLNGASFRLFLPTGRTHECMSPAPYAVFAANHAWQDWKRRHQRNFHMERRDLHAFEVMYICPRPVVLVTVRHGHADNLFPMDLIGPTDSPYFLMALRNTSPSIRLIRESQRMALADVPLDYSATAFKLGEHHEKERIEWDTLPFALDESPEYGLPVLRDALRLRDVVVRDTHVIGSHTMFITEVVREARRRDDPQMFFVSGMYHRYLALRGVHPPRAW